MYLYSFSTLLDALIALYFSGLQHAVPREIYTLFYSMRLFFRLFTNRTNMFCCCLALASIKYFSVTVIDNESIGAIFIVYFFETQQIWFKTVRILYVESLRHIYFLTPSIPVKKTHWDYHSTQEFSNWLAKSWSFARIK